jgi:hypothetical protein
MSLNKPTIYVRKPTIDALEFRHAGDPEQPLPVVVKTTAAQPTLGLQNDGNAPTECCAPLQDFAVHHSS